MVTLYAWAKPANLIGKWADHTWVTTYDNRLQQPGSLADVAAAGEHYWMCWGAFHRQGGSPNLPDGLIRLGEGKAALAGCVVLSNVDSIDDPAARGTVTLYAIHGVCHQVANQILHATATADEPPISVKGSRGYYVSVYFYRQYGRRTAAWATKLEDCIASSGTTAPKMDGVDDFLIRANGVLKQRTDLLNALLERRQRVDAELDAMADRPDLTAEDIDSLLNAHLVEIASELPADDFKAIFELDPGEEIHLVDREIFAASQAAR